MEGDCNAYALFAVNAPIIGMVYSPADRLLSIGITCHIVYDYKWIYECHTRLIGPAELVANDTCTADLIALFLGIKLNNYRLITAYLLLRVNLDKIILMRQVHEPEGWVHWTSIKIEAQVHYFV